MLGGVAPQAEEVPLEDLHDGFREVAVAGDELFRVAAHQHRGDRVVDRLVAEADPEPEVEVLAPGVAGAEAPRLLHEGPPHDHAARLHHVVAQEDGEDPSRGRPAAGAPDRARRARGVDVVHGRVEEPGPGVRVQQGDLPREPAGPPDVVGVDEGHVLPVGGREGAVAGGGGPRVLLAEEADPVPVAGRDGGGAVRGAVVHDDVLDPGEGLGEDGIDRQGEEGLPVVDGRHDAHADRPFHGATPSSGPPRAEEIGGSFRCAAGGGAC